MSVPTIASASTITLPSASQNRDYVYKVSGTTTINTISGGVAGTCITLIPTGAFTLGTSGNITAATTAATVGRTVRLVHDGSTWREQAAAAVTAPSWSGRRYGYMFAAMGTSTTHTIVGMPSPTLLGTSATQGVEPFSWGSRTSGAVIGNRAGWEFDYGTGGLSPNGQQPEFIMSASLPNNTNCLSWAGLGTSNNPTINDVSVGTQYYAGFRYSTTADGTGTFWAHYYDSSGTMQLTNTGISCTDEAQRLFRIYFPTSTTVEFYIDSVLVANFTGLALVPGVAGLLDPIVAVCTKAAAAKESWRVCTLYTADS